MGAKTFFNGTTESTGQINYMYWQPQALPYFSFCPLPNPLQLVKSEFLRVARSSDHTLDFARLPK